MNKLGMVGLAICLAIMIAFTACGQVNSENSRDLLNATPASTQMTTATTVPTTVPTTASTTVPTAATTTTPIMVTTTVSTTVLPTVNPTESANTQNKPPHVFSIRDEDKLILMRNAVSDDEALQQFLEEDSSALMNDREDVVAFLNLLDSLPNLTVEDAVSFTIQYFPEKSYIDVWYFMGEDQANSRRYLFTYLLDDDIAQETKYSILQEYADCTEKGQIINGISTISVLAKAENKAETELTKKVVTYWLDVDGWVVKVNYTHNQAITEKVTLEEVFAPMKHEETFQCS